MEMPMPGVMPPEMGMSSPTLDVARVQERIAALPALGPVYPKWLRKVDRPNPQKVAEQAIRRYSEYAEWRKAVRHDLMMLRMKEQGIFRDDKDDYTAGIIDEYSSHGLVDEFNLAVSWLGGLEMRVKKDAPADELRTAARTVRTAAQWMYDDESVQHVEKGEMPTRILLPKILLAYGRVAVRRTLYPDADPYCSPFLTRYIDPTQLVYDADDHGLRQIYRVYSAKVRDIVDTYGDFAPSQLKKIENTYGKIDDDERELTNVVEYWNRWYRCVTVDGVDILPVTEHRYGEVPYTIGFGPLGEPHATVMPEASGSTASGAMSEWRDGLEHKSVGYVRFRKQSHIMFEAMMKRELFFAKLDRNPPVMRGRSANAANNGPAPDIEALPGAANEYLLGEEEIKEFPFGRQNAMASQAIMQAIERDRLTGSAPMSAYGHMDQSNISGTANKQANSAGTHLWKPWVSTMESFLTRDLSKAMRIWQRVGHVVEYGSPQRRPFVVPNTKPSKGEPGAFELSRDVLTKVGTNLQVSLTSVNTDEWLVRSQTMQNMNQLGYPLDFLSDRLLGIEYDAQMREEWQEEQAYQLASKHPQFLELALIPSKLAAELVEAEGDPEQQQYLAELLQKWEEIVVQPGMLEHQMKMMQLQGQMMQPGPNEAVPDEAMPGGPPQQGPPGNMPGTTEGVSMSELGRGPGSVSGNQGGPRGALGPRQTPGGNGVS